MICKRSLNASNAPSRYMEGNEQSAVYWYGVGTMVEGRQIADGCSMGEDEIAARVVVRWRAAGFGLCGHT